MDHQIENEANTTVAQAIIPCGSTKLKTQLNLQILRTPITANQNSVDTQVYTNNHDQMMNKQAKNIVKLESICATSKNYHDHNKYGVLMSVVSVLDYTEAQSNRFEVGYRC